MFDKNVNCLLILMSERHEHFFNIILIFFMSGMFWIGYAYPCVLDFGQSVLLSLVPAPLYVFLSISISGRERGWGVGG